MITSNYLPSHYSKALKPNDLYEVAQNRAKEIVATVTEKDPILVFTGFSGIALATAVSIELSKLNFEFHMLMVRKEGESNHCHGESIQSSISRIHKDCCFIFVDDFIDSGKTLSRMDTVVSKFGGIKYVCQNYDLDTINRHPRPKLSAQDESYYSSLIIEVESE